jgi:hypothetical protein
MWLLLYHKKCKRPIQWPRGLTRRSPAARLLGLLVRILPGEWISVSCECSLLSGRGLCDGLITRPEESYRVWCVLSVIRCNNNPLHPPWVVRKRSRIRKKERNKGRKKEMKVELVQFVLSICVAGGFLHAWLLSCPALTVGLDSSVGIATR